MTRKLLLICLVCGSMLFSCAGLMKIMKSSTTVDLGKAPYYNKQVIHVDGSIGHLPIFIDQRISEEFSFFSQDRQELLEPIIKELNIQLNKLQVSTAVPPLPLPQADAPDIFVGNVELVDGESEDETLTMIARFTTGTGEWREQLAARMQENNVQYMLIIQLGFSEYLPRMTSWSGEKALELGTGFSVPLKWLSGLETPHEVLHLTGALMDQNGKAEIFGAEAITFKKTGFGWSLLEIQESIPDEQIANLLTDVRREDLPNAPLSWQVALQNLVAHLTGAQDLIIQ